MLHFHQKIQHQKKGTDWGGGDRFCFYRIKLNDKKPTHCIDKIVGCPVSEAKTKNKIEYNRRE